MPDITFNDKTQAGAYNPSKWNAQDANEVKAAVNSKVAKNGTDRLMTVTEATKLENIQAEATKNATDAQLRDRSTHTGTQTAASIADFQEAVHDVVGALLGANSNVTYNDANNTLTLSLGGGSGDPEAIRDAIGAALIPLGLMYVLIDDAGETISIGTQATQNSTDAQLRDRSTHTGMQPISTITGLQTALDAAVTDAELFTEGKIKPEYLPAASNSVDAGNLAIDNNKLGGLVYPNPSDAEVAADPTKRIGSETNPLTVLGETGGTNISAWPVFIANKQSTPQAIPADTFTKITLPTVVTDSHNGWDAANNWYVIPQAGVYRVEMKYRIADSPTQRDVSHGIGAHTNEEDTPSFLWSYIPNYPSMYRHGILNQRIRTYAVGDKIRLYAFIGAALSITNAELTIDRIR